MRGRARARACVFRLAVCSIGRLAKIKNFQKTNVFMQQLLVQILFVFLLDGIQVLWSESHKLIALPQNILLDLPTASMHNWCDAAQFAVKF